MSGSPRSDGPEPDLARLASLLQRFDVDCVLVGGMSARIYGSTVVTSDSDIVTDWSRASLEALCRALNSVDAQIRVGVDADGNDVFHRLPGGLDPDDIRHLPSFRVRTRSGDSSTCFSRSPSSQVRTVDGSTSMTWSLAPGLRDWKGTWASESLLATRSSDPSERSAGLTICKPFVISKKGRRGPARLNPTIRCVGRLAVLTRGTAGA